MLAIRFSRTGKRKMPYYRIVIMDNRKDPWGDFIENLGHYNPRTKELVLNKESVEQWLAKGAQPSKSIHNLLVSQGIIKDKKVGVSRISKKRQAKLDEKNKKEKESKQAPAVAEQTKEKPEEPKKESNEAEKPTEEKAENKK